MSYLALQEQHRIIHNLHYPISLLKVDSWPPFNLNMEAALLKKALTINKRILIRPSSPTHFVCFPLFHEGSRVKLERVEKTFRDEMFHLPHIPRRAFRLPQSYHIKVCSFRAATAPTCQTALQIFRSLDLRELLTHQSSTEARGIDESRSLSVPDPEKVDHNESQHPEALRIALKGLCGSRPEILAKCPWLFCLVGDSSQRLPRCIQKIRQSFEQAGYAGLEKRSDLRSEDVIKRPDLISTKHARSEQTYINLKGALVRRSISPRFDARGFPEKYQDFVWADDIQIQKLSLCKEGRLATFGGSDRKTLIDEGYEEVASIPLPY